MTTNQGIRISDNQNSLRSGERGPTLLEDFVLREKSFHFDHERIPERIVHARGSAAHGYFENYKSLSDITKADIFQRAGEKTPLFTRFSTVAGGAMLKADGQLAGSPSQLFDAVAVVLSQAGCEMLMKESAAVQFIMDAFGHLKAISASDAAQPLLDKAGVVPDDGITRLGKDFTAAARTRFWEREPSVRMLA